MAQDWNILGMEVIIKRSDGRQHPATVSQVNQQLKIVVVEWLENDNVNGKEVSFEDVLAYNPTLDIKRNPPPKRYSKASFGLSQSISNHSVAISALKGQSSNRFPRVTNQGVEIDRKSVIPTLQKVDNSVSQYSKLPNSHNNNVENVNYRIKKSSTVSEVEKLKFNREARRQTQAERKEDVVVAKHPNWQFLNMINEYRSQLEIKRIKDSDPIENHQITVCVRKRPLNKKEVNKKEIDVITVPRKDQIVVHEPKSKVDLTKYLENQQFRFDFAFDELCSNETVYRFTALPLVETIFEGGMATCFAYGQTGSGKTHTMGGTFAGKQQNCTNGIYAMVTKDVFSYLVSPKYKSRNLIVAASFFEIYSGKVFDLLAAKAKLKVLEDGKQQVQVVGLTETVVKNVQEVLALIQTGNKTRTSGKTSANANSSRSHAVFQITLRCPMSFKIHGKFSLIDLAGNERGADTSSADRVTRMEGAEINKSLLALKECIRALGRKGQVHLPFRASVLTQVLRDSFIGENSKTCMIAMISPGMGSCEHTLNTLRYADRVKELAASDLAEENNVPNGEEMKSDGLAALRSLNESEISADLYEFHEAISQIQTQEEKVIDALKKWVEDESTKSYLRSLIARTQEVDYDQENFSSDLLKSLNAEIEQVESLKEKTIAFNQLLRTEEEISKKIYPTSK